MNDKHKNLMLLEEAAETPVAVRFSEDGKFCYCGYSFAGTTSVDSPTWKIKRVEFADSGDMTHATLKKASEAIDTLLAVIQSSDVDLDTVQEIVTFIRSNRGVIDAVSTSKVDKSAYNEFTAKVDNALADIALSLAAKANRNHSHTPAEAGALSSDRTITINGTTKSLKDNPNFAILSNGEASEQWVAVGVQTIMEYIDVNGGVNIFSYAATLGQQRHGDYINTGGNGEELIILNLAYETDKPQKIYIDDFWEGNEISSFDAPFNYDYAEKAFQLIYNQKYGATYLRLGDIVKRLGEYGLILRTNNPCSMRLRSIAKFIKIPLNLP